MDTGLVDQPGAFPTLHLKLVASLRAAAPGACLSLHVEGTDSQTLMRGHFIHLQQQQGDGGSAVHTLIGGPSADDSSERAGRRRDRPLGDTITRRPGTDPLYVRVPEVEPGDYRLRLDLMNGSSELQASSDARRATLYAPLRVLAQALKA